MMITQHCALWMHKKIFELDPEIGGFYAELYPNRIVIKQTKREVKGGEEGRRKEGRRAFLFSVIGHGEWVHLGS
jgi:hypothetical protein